MSRVPLEAFTRACREADTEEFAGFVAALYEARGWTVRQDGQWLTLASDGARRRLVLAFEGTPDDVAGADAVVTRATGVDSVAGVEAVDLANLHRQYCYAVDSGTAGRLGREYLGLTAEGTGSSPDTDTDEGGDAERTGDRSRGTVWAVPGRFGLPSRRQAVLTGVVFLTVAAAVWVALGAGGVAPEAGPSASGTATPSATTAETPDGTATPGNASDGPSDRQLDADDLAEYAAEGRDDPGATPDGEGTTRSGGNGSANGTSVDLSPGVILNGSIDERALASAHRSIVANTSYTTTLTYRELTHGRVTGRYVERIQVVDGTRYVAETTSLGDTRSEVPRIAGNDTYANGSVQFTVANGTVRTGAVPGSDPFLNGTAALIRRYASAPDSMVVDWETDDGVSTYRLTTDGNTDAGIRNATGTLFVTERGLVTYGHWRYERPKYANVRMVVELETAAVGSTAVDRPPWASDGS